MDEAAQIQDLKAQRHARDLARWKKRNSQLSQEQRDKKRARDRRYKQGKKLDQVWVDKERRRHIAYNHSSLQRVLYQRLVGRISKCARRNKAHKSTLEILGCTATQLKAWLESQFTKGMSWENYGKWHIDHKVQCNRYDLSDAKQMAACFHYSNLRPLWGTENLQRTKRGDAVQSMLMLGPNDLCSTGEVQNNI